MRLFSILVAAVAGVFAIVDPALAAEGGEAAASGGLDAIAAGIGIGIAAFGGALGQGKAAAAALDSIGRNPGAAGSIQTPMLLGLAFIESLVLFALLIALNLVGMV